MREEDMEWLTQEFTSIVERAHYRGINPDEVVIAFETYSRKLSGLHSEVLEDISDEECDS